MKGFVIILMASLFIESCVTSKSSAGNTGLEILEATFHQWSEPPPPGSDVPERGTDLKIVVQNWPEDFTLHYVIYNQHKSLSAVIEDSTSNTVTINARIVRMSGVLAERSESTTQSDRLVFTRSDGEFGFIPIKNWQQQEH